MTSRPSVLALLLTLSLILVSCTTPGIGALKIIHDEIKKQFGEETSVRFAQGDIQSILYVTFENSPLNDRDTLARSRLAQKAANVAAKNYTWLRGVDQIWIMFLKIETRLVILNLVEQVDFFRFNNEAKLLKARSIDVPEDNPLRPRATYLKNADQSDIALHIQLAGQPGDGLTLIPHFTVAGNAEEEKASPPQEVSLDFAFFSRQPNFNRDMRVKFEVDGRSVFETKGKVSRYPADNGMLSEYCYVKIPYNRFKGLLSGEVLKIILGKTDYELTPQQLSALRRMRDFVTE
jgi:hypothetical protein